MKTFINFVYAAAISVLTVGCTEKIQETPKEAKVTISDVKVTENAVTFTITPENAAYYTYCVKDGEEYATGLMQVNPAKTGTFSASGLGHGNLYTIEAIAYNERREPSEKVTAEFETGEMTLDIPEGDRYYVKYGEDIMYMNSVFYLESEGMNYIYVSPLEGYDNKSDMLYGNGGKNDFVSFSMDMSLNGKITDMKGTNSTYALWNSLDFSHSFASDIDLLLNQMHNSISKGTFKMERKGEEVVFYMEAVHSSTGKTFSVYARCVYDEAAAARKSFMEIDGKKEEVGSAYYWYTAEDGNVPIESELYFSPAPSTLGELIDVNDSYHIRLKFSHDISRKEAQDITGISENFEFEYSDPVSGTSVLISNTDLKGAVGTLTVYSYAENAMYHIAYDITAGGRKLAGYMNGLFSLYSYYHANDYVVGKGTPVALKSCLADIRDKNEWHIYLSPAESITEIPVENTEDIVIISVPPTVLDGTTHQFGKEAMSITIGGTTYDKNTAQNTMSIRGAFAKDKIAIDFYDTNQKGAAFDGHYAGKTHILQ